jgi:hypothetical protein
VVPGTPMHGKRLVLLSGLRPSARAAQGSDCQKDTSNARECNLKKVIVTEDAGAESGGCVGGYRWGAAELGEEDAGEDEGRAEEFAGAESLVEEEQRGECGEDGLEG